MTNESNFNRVARAIEWITAHRDEQPGLAEIAEAVDLSPHYLQRTFQEWAGITPKQFLKSLTRQSAIARLKAGHSVLAASFESGLSGPGRLHDLTVTTEALTPGEIRRQGKGTELEYGTGETVFGPAFISWNQRGINFLGFCAAQGENPVQMQWSASYEQAEKIRNQSMAQTKLDEIFSLDPDIPTSVWLRGSPFQLKVWEALMAIPDACHASYGAIANFIGKTGASRAVGSAIGSNPIAWIVPCHRVIRQTGEIGGYRWGTSVKSAMIAYEANNSTEGSEFNSLR